MNQPAQRFVGMKAYNITRCLLSPSLGRVAHCFGTYSRSLVEGPTDVPLSRETVFGLLAVTAKQWPDRPAAVFVEQGLRFSWSQLFEQVETAAAGLAQLGVKKGDRVGIWSPNRAEWLVTQFATARLGAVLVNINPAYRLSELEYTLNSASVSVIVTATAFKSR